MMENSIQIASKFKFIDQELYKDCTEKAIDPELFTQLIQSFIPKKLDKEEELVVEAVFASYSKSLTVLFEDCHTILRKNDCKQFIANESLMYLLILLAGCQNNKELRWKVADRLHERLLTSLLEQQRCTTMSELLNITVLKEKTLALSCFEILASGIDGENLSYNPFSCAAFLSILKHLEYPSMNKHLGYTLPFALNLCEDYRPHIKLLGLDSLRHIAKHSLRAEMRHDGHADVHFEALKRLWYTRDPELLQLTYETLLDLLHIVVQPPPAKSSEYSWNRYDQVADRLLTDLSIECSFEVKMTLLEPLPRLLQLLGITAIKHSQKFFGAMENCLASYEKVKDLPVKMAALSCVELYISIIVTDVSAGRAIDLPVMVMKTICATFLQGALSDDSVAESLNPRFLVIVELLSGFYKEDLVKSVLELKCHIAEQMENNANSRKILVDVDTFLSSVDSLL